MYIVSAGYTASIKAPAPFYQTTWRHIPVDSSLHCTNSALENWSIYETWYKFWSFYSICTRASDQTGNGVERKFVACSSNRYPQSKESWSLINANNKSSGKCFWHTNLPTYREIYNIQYRKKKIRVDRVRCGAQNMLTWVENKMRFGKLHKEQQPRVFFIMHK
jgi:hypothetical protein